MQEDHRVVCGNCKTMFRYTNPKGKIINECPNCSSKMSGSTHHDFSKISEFTHHDFNNIVENFKNNPAIKLVDAGYQPDGTPYLKIKRFNNPVVKGYESIECNMDIKSCSECPLCAMEAEHGDFFTCRHPNLNMGCIHTNKEVYRPVSESLAKKGPPPDFCPLRNKQLTLTLTPVSSE